MSRSFFVCASAALLSLASCVSATLTLPSVIGSHMVLQRGSPATIWGWTSHPSSSVKISVIGPNEPSQGWTSSVQADATGAWSASMTIAGKPQGAGYSIGIKDMDSAIVLEDVAFGDVVLCSGQSNMELTVNGSYNAAQEIADSVNYPMLRMYSAAKLASLTPLNNLNSKVDNFNWTVAGPSAFEEGVWGTFSATCYFAGRDLYTALGGQVPVGLVASTWGGTIVEAWSTPQALAKCPSSTDGDEKQEQQQDTAATAEEMADPSPNTPSVLWNAMIAPLLQMQFKLVLWYQGEANVNNPQSYACRFPAMITDWRLQFNQALPFFFVQLAGYPTGGPNWPLLQLAQAQALKLPNVGMATAMDLGDPVSPNGAIHPQNKQAVGERLSWSVLDMVYGEDLVSTGPVPSSFALTRTDQAVTVTLSFPAGPSSQGMNFSGTEMCGWNMTSGGCCEQNPFELGDMTGVWTRADGLSVNADGTVSFSVSQIQNQYIVARYAFEDYPQCALYNNVGLPMTVFVESVSDDAAAAPAKSSAPRQPTAHKRHRGIKRIHKRHAADNTILLE